MEAIDFSKHNPALDGVRGLAILLVLIWHLCGFAVLPGGRHLDTLPLLRIGWSGVDLFFVLSGFLLGGILIDQKEVAGFGLIFYARRFFRIIPLYVVVLGAFFLIQYLDPIALRWGLHDKYGDLPVTSYLTFSQNIFIPIQNTFGANFIAPTWSLAIEEQFYLLAPALIWCVPRRFLLAVLLVGILICVAFRCAVYHWFSGSYFFATYTLLPCRADALLIGVLCAWTCRNAPWVVRENWFSFLFGALAVGWVSLSIFSGFQNKFMILFGMTLLAAFYGALLLALSSFSWPRLGRVFSFSLLRQIGKISYGIYLLNFAFFGAVFGIVLNRPPVINDDFSLALSLSAVAATLLVTYASFYLFELPMQKFGKRLFQVPSLAHRRVVIPVADGLEGGHRTQEVV